MKKQPTYEELLQENKKLRTENSRKDERIAYLERMLFGSKSDKAPKVDSSDGLRCSMTFSRKLVTRKIRL